MQIFPQNLQNDLQAFFISNTLISNARLKSKQKLSNTLRLNILNFSNYSLTASTLSSKNIRRYSKNVHKTSTCVLMTLYDVSVRFILFYSELTATDPRRNMLQTLLGRKKCEKAMSYEPSNRQLWQLFLNVCPKTFQKCNIQITLLLN